jgi:ribosomal protein S20
MKTLMKKVIFAVNEKREKDYIYSLLSEAISAIDKAGNKRVIHRNSANRKKSKLCRMVFEAVGAK